MCNSLKNRVYATLVVYASIHYLLMNLEILLAPIVPSFL